MSKRHLRAGLAAALLCAALAPRARAADFEKDSVGTTGGDFLSVDVGARGIGLGGAYSAMTSDANSLYWNPAGLAKVPRLSASFMYSRFVQDINYQSAAVAHRVGDIGVLAMGWRYRDIGLIDQTDLAGSDLGTFRPRDYVAEVGWGQAIYDLSDSELDINMGIAARWLRQTIVEDADSFAGDIGVQSRYYAGQRAYDFSFVAQNMGVGSSFDQRRDTLPFRVRLGAAAYPVRNLSLALEAVLPVNNIPYGAVGAEYILEVTRELKGSVRGGFNSLTLDSLDLFSGLSLGMGLKISDLTFDYAFVPMGVLGAQTHRFSVSFNLPAKISRRYRER